MQNIRFMTENYSNCVVLLNTGGVIDLTELRKISGVQAILLTGQTGNMGGHAVADVLMAKTVPSGKLTDTWARSYDDYPSSRTFSYRDDNLDDEYYSDGIYVGYRYFDTFGIMPLYCFGYGKGYTDFSLVTKEVTADEKLVKVEVEVTNIGKVYPGKEVVQVYYSAPDGVMEKPTQELAGFAKTKLLMPGEKEVVTVTFATEDMASYDSYDAAWVMEEGEYTIRVGNSSRTTEVAAIIDLDETVQTVLLKNVMKDKEFVKEILLDRLHASYVAVGEDYRFGYERAGTAAMLLEMGKRYGFETVILPKEMEGNRKVSSTYIREALAAGDMEKAGHLLGIPFFVEGFVTHGRGIGHKKLLPTVNVIPSEEKIMPPNGVYMTVSSFGEKKYAGITNIGYKPTVGGEPFLGVETFLFGCEEELYGKPCRTDFYHYSRPEKKFSSLDELRCQLRQDAENGKAYFGKNRVDK